MTRRNTLSYALLFLAAFALYAHSASPSVHPDDSAETVTAAATLSIQHPPGYPLHSVLGRLAVLSLPGAAALNVNLLSALCSAIGLCFFAAALMVLGATWRLALSATAVLALTWSLWFQSSIAKGGIYALNFMLSQAALYFLLQQRSRRLQGLGAARDLSLAALCCGLALANHWTSQVVLVPGMALLIIEPWWLQGRKRPQWRAMLPLLWVLAGLSLYLYLPLRSRAQPVLQWGDPSTLQGFWWVFNRAQYAGIEASKTLEAFSDLLLRVGQA